MIIRITIIIIIIATAGILRSVSDTPPTHFTLKIQLFSLLTKNNIERYNSGDFEAAGYKWYSLSLPPPLCVYCIYFDCISLSFFYF